MNGWQIKVFYDGACPLCRREAAVWQRLDKGRGRIALEDISAPGFDAGAYGLSPEAVMGEIHALLSCGAVVRGVEVFRQVYIALGLGWLVAPTRWPGIRTVADRAYRWFARNRLRFTGRATCDEACACGSNAA